MATAMTLHRYSILLVYIALLIQQTIAQSTGGSCVAVPDVNFSNYGFPDASNPTNFSCNGNQPNGPGIPTPLGSGDSGSPYSAALSNTATAFQKCETVYIPYFRKYFKFVDTCLACETDQASGKLHIDLYLIQSDANIGQTTCEDDFGIFGGQTFTVLRNPGPSLPYEPGALFQGGTCYNDASNGRVFPSDANNAGACTAGTGSPTDTAIVSTATSPCTDLNTCVTGQATLQTVLTAPTVTDTAVEQPTIQTLPTATTTTNQWGRWGGHHRRPPSKRKRLMYE